MRWCTKPMSTPAKPSCAVAADGIQLNQGFGVDPLRHLGPLYSPLRRLQEGTVRSAGQRLRRRMGLLVGVVA